MWGMGWGVWFIAADNTIVPSVSTRHDTTVQGPLPLRHRLPLRHQQGTVIEIAQMRASDRLVGVVRVEVAPATHTNTLPQPTKPPNTCPHTPTNQPTPNPKQVRWVSWPGAAVDLGSQEAVRRRLDMEYSCTPVFLSPEIADAYYHKVIWGFGLCVWWVWGLVGRGRRQDGVQIHLSTHIIDPTPNRAVLPRRALAAVPLHQHQLLQRGPPRVLHGAVRGLRARQPVLPRGGNTACALVSVVDCVAKDGWVASSDLSIHPSPRSAQPPHKTTPQPTQTGGGRHVRARGLGAGAGLRAHAPPLAPP